MNLRHSVLAVSVLSAFALAACGSSQPAATQQPSASGGNAQASGRTSAPAASTEHYHAELALAGQPALTPDGKDILVDVNVTNDGQSPFGTQATPEHNVNLGAHAIDSTGKVVDNDLARGSMPEAAPGATVKATILLPVDKVLGYSAELLPVEEQVAWFDKWGTKPLIVGPFKTCNDGTAGKICDTSGKPLRTAPVQP